MTRPPSSPAPAAAGGTTLGQTKGQKMTDNAFTAWLAAVELPTETIELCTDHRLIVEAERLRAQVEADKAEGGSLGDQSPSDELAKVRELMRSKTLTLTVQSPTEEAMLTIEKLREKDSEEWAAALVALAVVDPKLSVADAKKLRGRLDRGTWNGLFRRVFDVAVNRSLSVPFSWGDSGSDLT